MSGPRRSINVALLALPLLIVAADSSASDLFGCMMAPMQFARLHGEDRALATAKNAAAAWPSLRRDSVHSGQGI